MALASSLRKVAQKVIKQFGGSVTVRFISLGAYNTTTGAITETATDIIVQGVLENVITKEVNELVEGSPTGLISLDRKLTVAAADLTTVPGTKDRAVIAGTAFQIVQVKTIEQDNVAIVYEFILKI